MKRTETEFNDTDFQRSMNCETGACIEVAIGSDSVGIRDSKDTKGPVLKFSPEEWSTFTTAIRAGQFELIQ